MNSQADLCCLCLKYLRKQYCFLHKSSDEDISYYEKITSSFPQLDLKNYTEDNKLCIQCCSTINIVYNFIYVCKENVKVFQDYKRKLSSAKNDLIVQINDENIENKQELPNIITTEENIDSNSRETDPLLSSDIENKQELPNIITTEESIDSNSLETDPLLSSDVREESRTSNSDSNVNIGSEFDNFNNQNNYNVEYDITNNCSIEIEDSLEQFEFKELHSNVKIEIEEIEESETVPLVDLQPVEVNLQNTSKNNSISSLNFERSVNYNILCEVCGKTFDKRKQNFKLHYRTHKGIKNFICETCGKSFYDKGSLLIHKQSHTNTKLYSCDLCHRRYKKSRSVMRHKLTHHINAGDKPFQCYICDRRFIEKSSLKTHLRMHSGERPYSCNVCGKMFRHTSSMARHKLIHAGIKPYKCSFCSKAFRQKKNLDEHIMIHTGQKPIQCDKCGRRFRRKDHLVVHKCENAK